jgi:hypothetical protein
MIDIVAMNPIKAITPSCDPQILVVIRKEFRDSDFTSIKITAYEGLGVAPFESLQSQPRPRFINPDP